MTKALTAEQALGWGAGTSLRGHIRATRAEIERTFGAPTFGEEYSGDGKVTTEWVIDFGQGAYGTIYDWKRYELGAPEMDERIVWNIGGHDDTALDKIGTAMRTATYTKYPFDIFGVAY